MCGGGGRGTGGGGHVATPTVPVSPHFLHLIHSALPAGQMHEYGLPQQARVASGQAPAKGTGTNPPFLAPSPSIHPFLHLRQPKPQPRLQ